MRVVATLAFLTAVAFSIVPPSTAQGAESQELPHAFPRAGATMLLDNQWGTVWDATYEPGKPTPLHRHWFDFVAVELTDTTITVTAPDGQQRSVTLKRGDCHFFQRGLTHIEEVPSTSPQRHAVTIDLKDSTSEQFPNSSTSPTAFPADVAIKVIGNPRVTVWDYTWSESRPASAYFYDRNTFIVFLDSGGLMTSSAGDKPRLISVSPGQVVFRTGGRSVSEMPSKGNIRGIIVELN